MKPKSQRTMRMTIMIQRTDMPIRLGWFKHLFRQSFAKQSSKNLTIKAATRPRFGSEMTNPARSMVQIDTRLALFGRNNFSDVLDVLLDFTNLRMHLTDQIVLGLRKLFN